MSRNTLYDGEIPPLQIARVTLTAAQILDLDNTPVEIIAAPGPDKWICPADVAYSFVFNSVQYTGNITTGIRFVGGDDLVSFLNPDWTGAADKVTLIHRTTAAITALLNTSVEMGATLDTLVDGNSPVTVIVSYRVMNK